MTDQRPSVIEFSEDVSTQEAPQPLPPGDYPATIKHAEVKTSQRETKYAAVTFHISPDAYPADFTEGDPDGETIIFRRVPMEDTARSRFMLKRFCESIGATPSKRIDVNEWVGLEATVTVQHEEYEGMPRATITRVSPA
jgi:hypothetical protein